MATYNIPFKEFIRQVVTDPGEAVSNAADRAVYLGKQALAGAKLPFEQNNVVPGKPRPKGIAPPVAIDIIPALIGTGIDIGSGGKYKGVPYIQRAQQRVANADQFTNQELGIRAPETPDEFAANIFGSLLFPGPKFLKAPRSSTGVNIARGVAGAVTEAVLPLRQGNSIAKTAAVQVPVGLGLMEGVDAGFKSPEYTSFRNIVEGEQDEDPEAAFNQPIEKFLTPEQLVELQNAEMSGDAELAGDILDIAAEQQEIAASEEYLGPQPSWKDAAGTVVALGALGIGAGVFRHVARQRAMQSLAPIDPLSGLKVNEPRSGIGTKAMQGIVQHDQSIRDAAKELFQGDDYDKFLSRLDSVTAAPINTKTLHAFKTGELPKGTPKAALGTTLEAMTSELDDASYNVLRDGLLAKSALDDIKTHQLAFGKRPTQAAFTDEHPRDLQRRVDLVENDPVLAKYADQIRQHYRDEIDYKLERGLITPAEHAREIAERPNFVHMSRNTTEGNNAGLLWETRKGNSANEKVANRLSRAVEDFAGVQKGAAADPIRELPGQFAKTIREAEINDVKKEFLELASNNRALGEYVKRVSIGAPPNSMENVHGVLVNGVQHFYKITDPALEAALDFMPFANRGFLSSVLGVPKKMAEFFITGAGAPLFATTSGFYDTLTGIALRPKNYELGVMNEIKNKLLKGNDPEWMRRFVTGPLSTFDPTTWLSAPIGALRLGADNITESLANDLSVRLMKNNDWLVQTIGPQNVQLIRNRLAAAYQGSIKSIMDEYGATTNTYFSTTDPQSLARGVAGAAPNFYSASSRRAYDEALNGGTSFVEGLIKGTGSRWEQARANPLTRLYVGTVKLLHEGFRYQAFATNLPKVIGDEELTKLLSSQTRRISGDVGQTGGSHAYQEAANSAMYMNVGVQTLAQLGRMVKKQPVTTAVNMTSALGSMLMMQYLWAAQSQENIDELAASTDEENARRVKTIGGLEIPVPPELRMGWSAISSVMNEITGINDGYFDPDMAGALEAWMEDGFALDEEASTSLKDSLKSAAQSVSPINAGSSPLINAGASAMGVDLGFSRFTGEPQLIKGQEVSQLGGDGKLVGDAISATHQKMIQDLLGTTVADAMRAAMDAERVLEGDGTISDATRVALSRMKDNAVRAAGPARGLLFGQYERQLSANDTQQKMFYNKREGFDKAKATLNQDLLNQYTTGADERYAMLRNTDVLESKVLGTALVPIGIISADLSRLLYPMERLNSELRDQVEHTKNQRFSSIEERNAEINMLNAKRADLQEQMLNYIQIHEDQIRQLTGDQSFTFQNFDPEKYAAVPWVPPMPQAAEPLPPGP